MRGKVLGFVAAAVELYVQKVAGFGYGACAYIGRAILKNAAALFGAGTAGGAWDGGMEEGGIPPKAAVACACWVATLPELGGGGPP